MVARANDLSNLAGLLRWVIEMDERGKIPLEIDAPAASRVISGYLAESLAELAAMRSGTQLPPL